MYFKKMDNYINNILTNYSREDKQIACEKGCSTCCKNVPLIATKVEIKLIAQKLNTFNKILQDTIKSNIKKLDKKYQVGKSMRIGSMEDLNNNEKFLMSYPCAFLIGNSCTIYDVRPKICRTYYSSNKNICNEKGTADLFIQLPGELLKEYKIDYPENYKDNDEIVGHVHRCIDFKNNKFISLL